MYIIVAPIQIKDGHKDEFIKELLEDAKGSVNDEPGCLRFDVVHLLAHFFRARIPHALTQVSRRHVDHVHPRHAQDGGPVLSRRPPWRRRRPAPRLRHRNISSRIHQMG